MDDVCRDGIEERAIMGPGCSVSENGQQIPPALTQRRAFQAMSGDNLLTMPTHSGRLDTNQRKVYYDPSTENGL